MGAGTAVFAMVYVAGQIVADGKYAFGSVFLGIAMGYVVFVALLYGLDHPHRGHTD